jgi:hypothetical protein
VTVTCLCLALDTAEQQRSGFHYQYSCYQLEYSRNLLFTSGRVLDQVYQRLIDRTRTVLDVDKLKTIFGWRYRPHQPRTRRNVEWILDCSQYDLTVFKVHFGKLTLKMYDKGDRVLRIEAIAHNVKELRCGKILEKLPAMLIKLRYMAADFLNVLHAADHSYFDEGVLDSLPQPSQRGTRRLAGIDLQQLRMRQVCTALLALEPQPGGFSISDVAAKTTELLRDAVYTVRQAAYDLLKFRSKAFVVPVPHSRRYRLSSVGIRILAGLLILREKMIKPVLAGICRKKVGRPPKNVQIIDTRYDNLRREMFLLLGELNLIA